MATMRLTCRRANAKSQLRNGSGGSLHRKNSSVAGRVIHMPEKLSNSELQIENLKEQQFSAVMQLERQVERGSLFTHTVLGKNTLRLSEMESFAYGLIDVLLEKGVVSEEEIGKAAQNVRQELLDNGEAINTGVALRVDADEVSEQPVLVDCAARMHICKAVCCRLDFALSRSEVEAGNVKWDLGRPYFIRHDTKGRCAH